ncbi:MULTISPECIES: TerD family protein [Streptomyces]|uniref:TerD family protein n=2 Tax=Streptomyces TaxID=1883 RepID=A0ABU4K0R2_9ACTN|nr:TerD family protein [Streptomyces roseolus]MDX2291339.1 TerD family protein [Streptomyces roseolus]
MTTTATATLAKGGNAPLTGTHCRTTLTSAGTAIDVSAVLLGADGRVRSDDDLVFYNHPSQDGVTLSERTITVDLAAVPAGVDRVAIVASVDPEAPTARFDGGATPHALVECGNDRFSFAPPPFERGETVAVLVELYRRAGGWKARAVGQGWDTGLAGLATDFGIEVGEDAASPPEPPAPVPVPPPASVPVPPPPFAPPPAPTGSVSFAPPPAPTGSVSFAPPPAPAGAVAFAPPAAPAVPLSKAPLGKVTLTKDGHATIDMRKDEPGLVVTATLEWNGGSEERQEAGADLDLYALYVPGPRVTPPGTRAKKSDDAVYYRGLGSVSGPPYIALDGDARAPGRETVTIHRPDQQGYVLVCAYSAVENGTGSFRSFGARAVVTDGRGSTVEVPLFHDCELSYWVAIALIDFTVPEGALIRHVEQYSEEHEEARPALYSDGTFKMGAGRTEFKTL